MATSHSEGGEAASSGSKHQPVPDDVLALAVTIALTRARQRAEPAPPIVDTHADEQRWRWAGEPSEWS